MVDAEHEHWLFVIKNAGIAQMQHVMPDVANQMRWSSGPAEGSLPPNFTFVRVVEVTQLGLNFPRVVFEGEGLSKRHDCAYPLTVPDGILVTWLSRAARDTLRDAMLAALSRQSGAKVWFAGERGDAKTVRDAAKAAGWESSDLRVSGFWTRA